MRGLEVALNCFAGIGTVMVFLGTVGLIGDCMQTYGYIKDVFEFTYDNCKGIIMYKDYMNTTKHSVIDIPCPGNRHFTRLIPVTYSLWNTDIVHSGQPVIPYETAIHLYRVGIITLFLSIPGLVVLRWKNNS